MIKWVQCLRALLFYWFLEYRIMGFIFFFLHLFICIHIYAWMWCMGHVGRWEDSPWDSTAQGTPQPKGLHSLWDSAGSFLPPCRSWEWNRRGRKHTRLLKHQTSLQYDIFTHKNHCVLFRMLVPSECIVCPMETLLTPPCSLHILLGAPHSNPLKGKLHSVPAVGCQLAPLTRRRMWSLIMGEAF